MTMKALGSRHSATLWTSSPGHTEPDHRPLSGALTRALPTLRVGQIESRRGRGINHRLGLPVNGPPVICQFPSLLRHVCDYGIHAGSGEILFRQTPVSPAVGGPPEQHDVLPPLGFHK